MYPRVFKNTVYENIFQKNGFIKVPFLSRDEVIEITDKFYSELSHCHTSLKGFHTTNETSDSHLISEVNKFLAPYFLKHSSELLSGLNPIIASYLIKKSGDNSETPLHQDASFVDEPQNCSVSIWLALCDMDEHNGCLQFLEGSHLVNPIPRHIPYITLSEQMQKKASKFLTKNSIKAGEAFIFYNSIFHASGTNQDDKPRLAAVMGFYSANALLSLFVNEGDGYMSRYKVSPNDLTGFHKGINFQKDKLLSKHAAADIDTEALLSDYLNSRGQNQSYSLSELKFNMLMRIKKWAIGLM
jgi:ectoine hydroxylase-related dioxygenase (phytanoyl-CoA dioxygenase family)